MPYASSVFTSVHILMFLCVLSSGSADEPEIVNGPQTQIATVGSTVTFSCHAKGVEAYWRVNGYALKYGSYFGFVTTKLSLWNVQPIELSLSVNVAMEHNGTEVLCEVTGAAVQQVEVSSTAKLIVASVPLPPMPSASVTHATTIQLMWPVPFTHQGYGVDHYTVTVRNTATDNVFAANVSGTSYTYTRIGGVAQECEELMITVTASNTVGESSGATINAGFPIVPAIVEGMSVDVTPTRDATPNVTVRFELPETCAFQLSRYTVLVEERNAGVLAEYGPTYFNGTNHGSIGDDISSGLGLEAEFFSGDNPVSEENILEPDIPRGDPVYVEKDISSGLEWNRDYIVTVYVESLAGRSPNITASFNTTIATPTATVSMPNTHATMETSGNTVGIASDTVDTTMLPTVSFETTGKEEHTLLIVIGVVAGVVAVLLLTVSVLVIIFISQRHSIYREGNEKEKKGKSCPPMVSNPIYEPSTPEYEYLDDPSWKVLTSQPQSPVESSNNPRYFNIPPPLPTSPPPCKHTKGFEAEQTDVEMLRASFCNGLPEGDDCYAIMRPVEMPSSQSLQVPRPCSTRSSSAMDDEYVTIASTNMN